MPATPDGSEAFGLRLWTGAADRPFMPRSGSSHERKLRPSISRGARFEAPVTEYGEGLPVHPSRLLADQSPLQRLGGRKQRTRIVRPLLKVLDGRTAPLQQGGAQAMRAACERATRDERDEQ